MNAVRLWLILAFRCWLRTPATWLALTVTFLMGLALLAFGIDVPRKALDELALTGVLVGILVGGLQLRASQSLLVQADFRHRWLGPVSFLVVTGFLQLLATRVALGAASGELFHLGEASHGHLGAVHRDSWLMKTSWIGLVSHLVTTSTIAACCFALSRTRTAFAVSFLAIAWILPRLLGEGESGTHQAARWTETDRVLPVAMPGEGGLELLRLPGRVLSTLSPEVFDAQGSLAPLIAWLAVAALLASRIEARAGAR